MQQSNKDNSDLSDQEDPLYLGPDKQDHVLRQALETVPSLEAAQAMRQLLSPPGVGLVLLGQLLRARDIAKENVITADLTSDHGRMMALRIQGQASGINLAIDTIFEIANYRENKDG